tara:strand:+ start:4814 stop:5122 length:309 start_codon:yes stop_codon:yes gene_type:complete
MEIKNDYKKIKFNDFKSKYGGLETNDLDDRKIKGFLFSFKGKDRFHILSKVERELTRKKVWTLLMVDGKRIIHPGDKVCRERTGYFISKKRWKTSNEVYVID